MANFILSTNMNLPVPIVGVAPGPEWADDVNGCLSLIDSHDHSPGYGVPITPAGINISSDLSFGGNNATTFRSVRFQPQSATLSLPTDIGCLYEVSDDLYYNDGAGNQVRITQGGNVSGAAGTITGLPSGTASASFAAGVFTFNASTNTGANMRIASLLLRNNSAGSQVLTLSPPLAMGASYALVLPSVPGATNLMTLDASGNMAAVTNVDNSTLQLSTNVLSIKDGGVTPQKMAALGQQLSASGGLITTTVQPSFDDVTDLTVTITTTGRPVFVGIIPDGGSSTGVIRANNIGGAATGGGAYYKIDRGGTTVLFSELTIVGASATLIRTIVPCSSLYTIDVVGAGTYTYQVKIAAIASGSVAAIQNAKLIAYEIF